MKDINIQEYKGNIGDYHKKLKTEVVYGPINSRRLGLSLGINPIQGGFGCNFACTYCQYGLDDLKLKLTKKKIHFTRIQEIERALKKRLQSTEHFDSITICGPTEPILHPQFDDIVDIVVRLRDNYRQGIPTSLFTNAHQVVGLNTLPLDYVFMKLDAGNEETFQKINQPRGKIKLRDIVNQITGAEVKRRILQTMIVDGEDGNHCETNIRDYIEVVKEIAPEEVHLYTILYKPAFGFDIRPLNMKQLNDLAKEISRKSKIKTIFFIDPVPEGELFKF